MIVEQESNLRRKKRQRMKIYQLLFHNKERKIWDRLSLIALAIFEKIYMVLDN